MAWTARLAAGLCVAALTASPALADDGFDRLRAAADGATFNMERDAIRAVQGRLEIEVRLIARHVDGESLVPIRASIDGAAAMLVRRRPEGWPQNPARRAERPIAGVAEAVLADPVVEKALARFADDDERAALARARDERESALRSAQHELVRILAGREMRLRQPALDQLSDDLWSWLEWDRPEGDVVVQAVNWISVHPELPADAKLTRKSLCHMVTMQHIGRDPAIDFAVEALALARHHGWPESATVRLVRAGTRLGETFRRESGLLPEQRSTYPIRPLLDPSDYPLWVALVELTEDEHGAGEDPGPALVGDDEALVRARAELTLAALEHTALLGDDAATALAAAARAHAEFELSEAPEQLALASPHEVLECLRLVPGGRPTFGAGARRELVDAVAELVDDTQARALSIER